MMPPARLSSAISFSVAGDSLHRLGVESLIFCTRSRSREMPHSSASANRCSTVLVEAPIAMSSVSALMNDSRFKIMRGVTSLATRFMIASPARLARRMRSAETAGIVPLPGRAMPSASARQLSELAVYMPQQLPQPGQAQFSSSFSSSSEMVPAFTWPTASNIDDSDTFRPR